MKSCGSCTSTKYQTRDSAYVVPCVNRKYDDRICSVKKNPVRYDSFIYAAARHRIDWRQASHNNSRLFFEGTLCKITHAAKLHIRADVYSLDGSFEAFWLRYLNFSSVLQSEGRYLRNEFLQYRL